MTTENKAKGYNEDVNEPIGFADAQDFFTEPKEGEDERIRKNCIHFLELQKSHHASTFEIEECIAWLEKQGNYNGLVEKAKAYNEARMQDVRERAAIAAMQGMLSNPAICLADGDTYPKVAVEYADALIEQLEEN